MADLELIAQNVIDGRLDESAAYPPDKKGQPGVTDLVKAAIDEGVESKTILEQGLIAGMSTVGERFKRNECFVPEVLIAARAMKAGVELLRPLLAESGVESCGTFIIGTVKGDLHDIGKNLVMMMLEGAGFDVIDLGVDVSPEKFADAVKSNPNALVGMSALITTTMPGMKDVVQAVRDVSDTTKAMIGGAPVTQSFADEIGADGYAPDAATAVDKAKELLGIS